MHYVVYIDKIWLMDFVMSTYLLLFVRQAYGLTGSIVRLLLAAAAGASVFILSLFLPGVNVAVKILFQVLCINPLLLKAAFSFRTKEMVVRSYICMNGCGLLMGGVLGVLSAYLPGMRRGFSMWKVLMAETFAAGLISLWLYLRKMRKKNGGFYTVTFDFYGEALRCRGFADSGNSLYEPYGKRPVVILTKQAAAGLLWRVPPQKHYLIPFHSIGKKHGLLVAVELPAMEVDDGEQKKVFRNVVAALSEEAVAGKGNYQVILHPAYVTGQDL